MMYSQIDTIEVMVNDGTDNFIAEIFKSLQNRYQNNLEELIKGSKPVFGYVYLLYYKCHKINPNHYDHI